MSGERLQVLREIAGEYEIVGVLEASHEGARFSYSSDYLSRENSVAISASLPLREGIQERERTRAFFDGLLPEGPLRRSMSDAFRTGADDYQGMLSRLNNESAGALVFCLEGEDPTSNRRYDSLPFSELEKFARQPRASALAMNASARLSLAGAQAKVGLHHVGDDWSGGWSFPRGSAPSTCIVKAVDGTFPGQTINEALCLRVASRLGFDVARAYLLDAGGGEPLLIVERFDRLVPADGSFPRRRHQEDFCQSTGLKSDFKYEPTDGHYASRVGAQIARVSGNPFGDRVAFVSGLLLDWALGNCDNHLKNHSMLWDERWGSQELAPLYDLTCTTCYPLDREMGVSLCRSRLIDDVTRESVCATAKEAGVPEAIVRSELEELCNAFLPALQEAEDEIAAEGFEGVTTFARHIADEFTVRRDRL